MSKPNELSNQFAKICRKKTGKKMSTKIGDI